MAEVKCTAKRPFHKRGIDHKKGDPVVCLSMEEAQKWETLGYVTITRAEKKAEKKEAKKGGGKKGGKKVEKPEVPTDPPSTEPSEGGGEE